MRRYWWWAGAAIAVLALAMLVRPPMQPRSTQPNQITQRQMGKPTTPPGSTTRGTELRKPTAPTPTKSVIPTPTKPNTDTNMNRRVRDAADSVDGVKDAWAVVTTPNTSTRSTTTSDRVAFVGVTLEDSIKGSARTSTIDEVSKAVREVPGIQRASVTATPTTVERIKRISEGMAKGKTPTMFAEDLKRVSSEMLSKAK